jgi:hypothetical protein
MAITRGRKSIRQVQLQVTPFLKVSEVWAPPAEFRVAGYLPITDSLNAREDGQNEEWITVEGGRAVAITATSDGATGRWANRLTLANGGSARTVTYAADDIDEVEDIDVPNTLVAAAGAGATADAANFPIGVAPYPYYRGILDDLFQNYELQPFVAVWNMGYFEYPIVRTIQVTGDTAIRDGGLVKPGVDADAGFLVNWTNGTDSVDQIMGRVWKLETIASTRGLDKVHTVRGLGLSGTGTSGIPAHLAQTIEAGGDATLKFRVAIVASL